MSTHPVIYLTGQPASGKSTTVAELRRRAPRLAAFDFGAELLDVVNAGRVVQATYDELRANSAGLVDPAQVHAMDERLIEWVGVTRRSQPVVIDSHAVTREEYGFRVTAFSADQLRRLQPTHLFALFSHPDAIGERLAKAPAGRLASDAFHLAFHAAMQLAVVITYCIELGLPLEVLSTDSRGPIGAAERILDVTGLA